ncbi:hypothetical protein BKA16_000654 [Gordonia humi]|uniref:Uncharacterized protein n=1 Tax=Gordonia humi TaxID=686429 RepID=A0A840EQW7_9ACTN|nr:hypothetical protein [Gordonia humi]
MASGLVDKVVFVSADEVFAARALQSRPRHSHRPPSVPVFGTVTGCMEIAMFGQLAIARRRSTACSSETTVAIGSLND